MDFFEQQDAARRKTKWLVCYFILAVVLIVVAIYLLVWIALAIQAQAAASKQATPGPNPFVQTLWHPELLGVVAVATIGVIFFASLYKTSQLSAGGEAVALMMGARLIDSQTGNPAERRLLNVVQEMALASGTPVPPVYVMDNEPSINAFAAGHEAGDAVIGVSRGCLEYLDRDELQGVMAHEFSHILNGDMRLNLRLIGILHGILILAILGWYVLNAMRFSSGRRDNRGAAMIMIVGLGLIIIGGVGLLFGKLIKSALSRQREYLADASAVQFTRSPGGIAGALTKIGGRPETSKIEDAHAVEISHMFFGSAVGSFRHQLFATHPPLVQRIQRIDSSFDGNFPEVKPVKITPDAVKPKRKQEFPTQAIGGAAATAIDPTGVLGQIGVPGMEQILYAAAILESMPDELQNASQEPYAGRAVIYAILLDRQEAMRKQQLDALRPKAEDLSFRETQRLAPLIDKLPDESRMPLVEMTFPALKKLSPDQYGRFRENVDVLINADNKVDLLEYAVRTVLVKHLDVHFQLAKPVAVRYHRLATLLPSLVAVLSTLAYVGQDDETEIQEAFDKGMAEVNQTASLLPKSECSLSNLEKELKVLGQAAPKIKRHIVKACVACVAADGKVTPREGQLLQVITAILGVPVPPIGATA